MGGRSGALDSVAKDKYNLTIQKEWHAVTQDGCIVVADYNNHRLQVLTAEGAFIATVGSEGSQPLQFKYPRGVAVHHNGQVFVAENGNHCVQVLNADLTYSHCFGSKGTQSGKSCNLKGIREHGSVSLCRDGQKTKWRLQCKY